MLEVTGELGGRTWRLRTNKLSNTTDATEKEIPGERRTETGEGNDLVGTREEFCRCQRQRCSEDIYPRC